jgi:carbon monoxide dehydrogenase subunit G
MEFENKFSVDAPIEQVWETLLDVERVAPCMPGAEVLERTGEDRYKVAVRVRVGPVSMQYRGDVEIVDRDAQAHRAVMDARAKEARGQGTANASIEMRLSENGGGTDATLATDLKLSGKAAAMGRGVIQDVSANLVETFADNLAKMLSEGAAATPAAEAAAAQQETPERAPAQPPPPATEQAEDEPALPALSIAGDVLKGRMRDPRVLLGSLGVVALLALLVRRRRRT